MNAKQSTAYKRQLSSHATHRQQAGIEQETQQFEPAARGENQVALERATAKQQSSAVSELLKIEQVAENTVSDQKIPLLTQVHRVAEIALEELENRVSDEQALHEFRARDELSERPTTGAADMEQQRTAHNPTVTSSKRTTIVIA